MPDSDLIAALDLAAATGQELRARTRLMPGRPDRRALASQETAVTEWLAATLPGWEGDGQSDIVLASKPFKGLRPLSIVPLDPSVLYRALVDRIALSLPDHLRHRSPMANIRMRPLQSGNASYVVTTDVASYYEYIDHDFLARELVAQTGEASAVAALSNVLFNIMGRRVGIPQVSSASDILGDTYIDVVRRRLIRRGITTHSYSDDFIIEAGTLAESNYAIEQCSIELRRIGLVINDRKTYTHTLDNYKASIEAFDRAQREVFDSEDENLELLTEYEESEDEDTPGEFPPTLAKRPSADVVDPQLARAANRAYDLWVNSDPDTTPATIEAIRTNLMARALPILGRMGNPEPIRALPYVLSYQPGFTPEIVTYLREFVSNGPDVARQAARALSDLVGDRVLGPWQEIWLAEGAATLSEAGGTARNLVRWLHSRLESDASGVAATAAATLGRLRATQPASLSPILDRLRPEWRMLALWGLSRLDLNAALRVADNNLDRLMIESVARE